MVGKFGGRDWQWPWTWKIVNAGHGRNIENIFFYLIFLMKNILFLNTPITYIISVSK
jgi:hypothetical protein